MWDVLLLFSSICTAVVVGAPVTVSGFRGERVEIRCPYGSGYETYSKYFCKGECSYGNRNIKVESGSPAKDERFSLTDDTTARVFTVTITDLRTEDEGQYWCVVERTIVPDDYSEILLLVKQAVVVGAPVTVSGFRGERVEIRCSYESGYETYPKYFCKEECKYVSNKNIMVKSGSPAKDERFSLTDDTTARVFTVTITDLRTEDEGQYWCGVERTGPDVYSEILLQVKMDIVSTISSFSVSSESETNPSSRITDHQISSTGTRLSTPHRPSEQEVKGIIVTAEALVLLLIGLPLIIVAVLKRKKKKGLSSIEVFDPVFYEQITERHCNPEDRDTETTVIYTCAS